LGGFAGGGAEKTPAGDYSINTPSKIGRVIELEDDQKRNIMDFHFRELEGEEDFAERSWRLAKHRAFPVQNLASRFEEERSRSKNARALKGAMRKRLMSSLLEKDVSGGNPLRVVEVLGLLKSLKVKIYSGMDEAMDQALKTWKVEVDCEKALDKLKEMRIFTKTRWKEWWKKRKRKPEDNT
jgi:ribosomal protein S21